MGSLEAPQIMTRSVKSFPFAMIMICPPGMICLAA